MLYLVKKNSDTNYLSKQCKKLIYDIINKISNINDNAKQLKNI